MKRLLRFILLSASALRRGVCGADPVPRPPVFVGLVEGTFGKAGGRVKVRFDAPVFARDAKYEGYTLALHYRPCRCRRSVEPWPPGTLGPFPDLHMFPPGCESPCNGCRVAAAAAWPQVNQFDKAKKLMQPSSLARARRPDLGLRDSAPFHLLRMCCGCFILRWCDKIPFRGLSPNRHALGPAASG